MPGLRNSVTVNGSPGFTPISAAMRARRAGSILACATRITSSYDMRTARCRAVSRSRRPPARALVGGTDRAPGGRDRAAHRRVLIGDEPARAFDDDVARAAGMSRRSRARDRRAVRAGARRACRSGSARAWRNLARACAAARPARKPRRLASTALPSARIAASNASRIGSRPQPAIRPSITALIMAPLCLASASMSTAEAPAHALDRLDQPRAVVAAVAHRHLLHHQVGARGRGDQQVRSGVTKPAAMARPASSSSLASTMSTSPTPGAAPAPALAAEVARRHRHDLDVIGGGAGALGDAGDRGASAPESPCAAPARDDPVGEHAAAFAAERGDQDGDRPAARAHARACARRPPNQPMTVRRTRCSARSHQFGLRMISAR